MGNGFDEDDLKDGVAEGIKTWLDERAYNTNEFDLLVIEGITKGTLAYLESREFDAKELLALIQSACKEGVKEYLENGKQ